MKLGWQPLRLALILLAVFLLPHSNARADGGTIRLHERVGTYQITVFTSPTPFRAGVVDISVLVQDANTAECISDTQVTVRLQQRDTREQLQIAASAEAATNKLYRAAVFPLPAPGWWDVDVAVVGPTGPAQSHVALLAEPPLPRWLELWPWFTWPFAVVALFSLHQILVRRRSQKRPSAASTG
jgi:hypothetical protein